VVKAQQPVDSDGSKSQNENKESQFQKGRNKNDAKKEKKTKVPAGFALLHGFTATNVGKNRLTV
jgi:hypothetical protein